MSAKSQMRSNVSLLSTSAARLNRTCPWVLLLAGLTGAYPPRQLAAQQTAAYEELQSFSAVLNHIRLNYVDSVTYTELVRAAINGVLHSLDPHSAFFSRREFSRRAALERGELAASGLQLERVDDAVTVLGVAEGSAAAKAGVYPGDRVLTINDTAVAGLDVKNVELRLAGEKGSKVHVRLERGSRLEPDTLSLTLKLDWLRPRSVSTVRMVDASTGYIHLERFGAKAADEVHA
jgi:carboxyl-terminal processing protease